MTRISYQLSVISYQLSVVGRNLGLASLLILFSVGGGFGQAAQSGIAEQADLVTEFEVNGLKVLVKRRANSPTVAAGLFIRGGARNPLCRGRARYLSDGGNAAWAL